MIAPRHWILLAACVLAGLPALAADTNTAPADPNAITDATRGAASFIDSVAGPVKAAKDVNEDSSACFNHADYLRAHHDPFLAASYLKEIATNGNVLPQDRSRAIIELADTLQSQGNEAEALCWLKTWCELFPGRREFAGKRGRDLHR